MPSRKVDPSPQITLITSWYRLVWPNSGCKFWSLSMAVLMAFHGFARPICQGPIFTYLPFECVYPQISTKEMHRFHSMVEHPASVEMWGGHRGPQLLPVLCIWPTGKMRCSEYQWDMAQWWSTCFTYKRSRVQISVSPLSIGSSIIFSLSFRVPAFHS